MDELVYIIENTLNTLKDQEILKSFIRAFLAYPQGIIIIDKDGVVYFANKVVSERLGVPIGEIVGKCIWDLLPSQISNTRKEKLLKSFETKEPVSFVDTREGKTYQTFAYPIIDKDGEVNHLLILAEDITEKSKILETLELERAQLLSIFNSIDEAIYVTDPISNEIIFVNKHLRNIMGKDVIGGICYKEFQNLDHICEFCTNPIILANKGEAYKWEHHNPVLNRDYYLIDRIITWPDGRDVRLEISIDITKIKDLQRLLEENEKKYRDLFNRAPVGYRELDVEGRTVDVNKRELEMLGYEKNELIGKFIWENVVEEDLCKEQITRYLKGLAGDQGNFEVQYKRKDGSTFPALIDVIVLKDPEGMIKGMRTALLDITELVKAREEKEALENQLLQAQKMEAIGKLAGGIAHDFNNMLTVIKGMCQLSLLKLDKNDPIYYRLKQIEITADKAAELTNQLLAFSRRQVMEMKVLNLNDIIINLEHMLRRIIGENIELVTLLDPNLCMLKGDPTKLTQVVMNLVVNAKDAMPQGGKIIIETKNVELDEAYVRQHVDAQCGGHVMLAVTDTGIGIPKEVLPHIYEPFFTTKEMGKGTGLGLSTVYGIVKQSGGNIYVYSEMGKGTTFKIYLPAIYGKSDYTSVKERDFSPKGSETILVIEDDQWVREVIVSMLSEQGYEVLEASNREEAESIAKNSKQIHLVLTDVILKGTTGLELCEVLKKMNPNLKFIFMSGYTENVITNQGVLKEGINFIQKPFNLNKLLEKIREVLQKN